jgi:hypothetical protein
MPAKPVSDLYHTARRLARAPASDFDDVGRGVQEAVRRIVASIMRSVEPKVVAAATVGATHIDILRFHGNDLDEVSGFPMLTLVKGPRDHDLRAVSGPTLIERLQEVLEPFEVHHTWHTRSNINRIVLRWDRDVADNEEDEEEITATDEATDEIDDDDDDGEDEEEVASLPQDALGDARVLLQALQRQLQEVEAATVDPSAVREYLTTVSEEEEEEEEELAPEMQDLRASLASLMRRLQ